MFYSSCASTYSSPVVDLFPGVCGAFWDWMGGLLLELDFEYGVVLGLVPVDFPTSSNLLL